MRAYHEILLEDQHIYIAFSEESFKHFFIKWSDSAITGLEYRKKINFILDSMLQKGVGRVYNDSTERRSLAFKDRNYAFKASMICRAKLGFDIYQAYLKPSSFMASLSIETGKLMANTRSGYRMVEVFVYEREAMDWLKPRY